MAVGISLHIGVDRLNPADYPLRTYPSGKYTIRSYDGDVPTVVKGDRFEICWDGPLRSCQKDAADMFKIADEQGFTPKLLDGPKATLEDVVKEIESAAETLHEGDIFFLTFAGHGNQVTDINKDERRGRRKTDDKDETWCLFDGMLLDDEQSALYAKFREGVRIIVLSDSCHSGTVTRSGKPKAPELGDDEKLESRGGPGARGGAMDVYYERQKFYDGKQVEPAEVKASLILISACQDHQVAGDGADNGTFTKALRGVWKDWKNSGVAGRTYADFHGAIKEALKEEKQIPNFLPNDKAEAAFVKEEPFTI